MTAGKKVSELGNEVSYAIKSIFVGFKGFKLKYGKHLKKPINTTLFEFESQNLIKSNNMSDENSVKSVGQILKKTLMPIN